MTPLSDLADVEMAQLVAVSARLPFEQRAGFVQRVVAALTAGEISLLDALAVAQRAISAPRRHLKVVAATPMALALETVPTANGRAANRALGGGGRPLVTGAPRRPPGGGYRRKL